MCIHIYIYIYPSVCQSFLLDQTNFPAFRTIASRPWASCHIGVPEVQTIWHGWGWRLHRPSTQWWLLRAVPLQPSLNWHAMLATSGKVDSSFTNQFFLDRRYRYPIDIYILYIHMFQLFRSSSSNAFSNCKNKASLRPFPLPVPAPGPAGTKKRVSQLLDRHGGSLMKNRFSSHAFLHPEHILVVVGMK